jgi:hypothetical protein
MRLRLEWGRAGLDIISSDSSARTLVHMRCRTTATATATATSTSGSTDMQPGGLALRRGVALKLDGLDLHGTWRNGPAVAIINGQTALVTSDEQDEAHLCFRVDDHNPRDRGKLRYRVPNSTQLRHIQTNYLHSGATGRLKYSLVDYDGDGLLDLLLGTCGYHSIPSNTTGLPACAPPARSGGGSGSGSNAAKCGNNGATVLLMLQSNPNATSESSVAHLPDGISAPGAPADAKGGLIFEWPQWITVRDVRVSYGGPAAGVSPNEPNRGNAGWPPCVLGR